MKRVNYSITAYRNQQPVVPYFLVVVGIMVGSSEDTSREEHFTTKYWPVSGSVDTEAELNAALAYAYTATQICLQPTGHQLADRSSEQRQDHVRLDGSDSSPEME